MSYFLKSLERIAYYDIWSEESKAFVPPKNKDEIICKKNIFLRNEVIIILGDNIFIFLEREKCSFVVVFNVFVFTLQNYLKMQQLKFAVR